MDRCSCPALRTLGLVDRAGKPDTRDSPVAAPIQPQIVNYTEPIAGGLDIDKRLAAHDPNHGLT